MMPRLAADGVRRLPPCFQRAILRALALLAAACVSGCAPTWEIGGAYFPAWLLCMVGGLACVLAARFALIRLGLDPWIRPRALAYPALGIFFTILIYLLFFT
jgi:hypothetical protein